MKISVKGMVLFVVVNLSGLMIATVYAGAGEPGHGHGHGDSKSGHHAHDKWVAPPDDYAGFHSDRWSDSTAIKSGKQLYQKNCSSCHGEDGRGTGPLASQLPHAPADLTNHFHRKPGDGDAYLFWRVSEGGAVEPFKAMQSSMPAFKTSLTTDERWDLLAYVHATFHKSFLEQEHHKKNKHHDHDQGHKH